MTIPFAVLLGFTALASATSASANEPARCGDTRAVQRISHSPLIEKLEDCQKLSEAEKSRQIEAARKRITRRLTQFDGECVALGGKIQELQSEVKGGVRYYQTDLCGMHGDPEQCLKAGQYCDVAATVIVTHGCSCSDGKNAG